MKDVKEYSFVDEQVINKPILENTTIDNKKIKIYIEKEKCL